MSAGCRVRPPVAPAGRRYGHDARLPNPHLEQHHIADRARAHPIAAVMVVALGARLVVVLVATMIGGAIVPDESGYLAVVEAAGDGSLTGYARDLFSAQVAYLGPTALLHDIAPASYLTGRVLAAVAGAATAGVVTAVAANALPAGRAIAAGLVVALLPSQVLWSSAFLRESTVWLACALIALALVRVRTHGWPPLAVAALALGGLAHLRGQTLLVATLAFVAAGAVVAERWGQRVAVLAIGCLVPLAAGVGPFALGLVTGARPIEVTRAELSLDAGSTFVDLERIPSSSPIARDARRLEASRTIAGSGALARSRRAPFEVVSPDGERLTVVLDANNTVYLVETGIRPLLDAAPGSLVAVALRPFPWEANRGSAGATAAAVEAPAWLVLYGAAVAGTVRARQQWRTLAFPALFTVGILAAGALSQGNLGTAFRHRGQIVWSLAALAMMVPMQRERGETTA